MSCSRVMSLCIFAFLGPQVSGNAFLKKTFKHEMSYFDQDKIEDLLLGEVRGFLGSGHKDLNLAAITEDLKPMWLSLPKNSNGKLGNEQVRYALHRYFVQRHGWHIDGIADSTKPSFDAAAAVTGVLEERVPAYIMGLFEEAFGTTGLLLHELAIFAVTIEHIIHDEASDRLNDMFKALGKSFGESIQRDESFLVADAFLLSILSGKSVFSHRQTLMARLQVITRAYPGWVDTKSWLDDTVRTLQFNSRDKTNPFLPDREVTYGQTEHLIQHISETFGPFQNRQCIQLKNELLDMEEGDTGRVKLSDFYKAGVAFKEKPEVLRAQGALDETKPGEARVIITNYVLSPTNCLADTGFYSICCGNECEGVLARIEAAVAAPTASPSRILEIVKTISTATVSSGSTSDAMATRLRQVAARNGGMVPLHGRLFAQWLHLVFPRECPYPHASSSNVSPLSASEWMTTRKNVSFTVGHDKLQEYIDNATDKEAKSENKLEDLADLAAATWSEEEEILYVPAETRRIMASSTSWVGFLGRATVFLAVVTLAAAAVAIAARKVQVGGSGSCMPQKAHLV